MNAVKRKFSHLGFALIAYLVIANVLGSISSGIYTFIKILMEMISTASAGGDLTQFTDPAYIMSVSGSLSSNALLLVIISMVPGYFIGVPLTLLILNAGKYRDVPLKGLDFYTPYEKTMKRDLSLKEFLMFFLFTFPMGIIGSTVGGVLAAVFTRLTGYDMTNVLDSVLVGMSPVAVLISTVILAPIFEEILFRYGVIGYARRYGEWNAIIVSAVIFGLIHTNVFQFFYAFLLGIMFGYIYVYTRQLKYTIGLHILFNFFGAFVPLMISPDASMTPALAIYSGLQYLVAAVGLVFLILFIKNGNLLKTTEGSPVPGICSKDSFLNFGMISFIIVCLVLTVFIGMSSSILESLM
jgi:membrane protease YdiL (CAAX protease family)